VFRSERRSVNYARLPHSEIPGSKLDCSSPRRIVACHVLHRPSAPRHPPCALCSLISFQTLSSTLFRIPTKDALVLPLKFPLCSCQSVATGPTAGSSEGDQGAGKRPLWDALPVIVTNFSLSRRPCLVKDPPRKVSTKRHRGASATEGKRKRRRDWRIAGSNR
jgi:hypothetical protein